METAPILVVSFRLQAKIYFVGCNTGLMVTDGVDVFASFPHSCKGYLSADRPTLDPVTEISENVCVNESFFFMSQPERKLLDNGASGRYLNPIYTPPVNADVMCDMRGSILITNLSFQPST